LNEEKTGIKTGPMQCPLFSNRLISPEADKTPG